MSATNAGRSDLDKYRLKREPGATPEPFGDSAVHRPRVFVVQKHAARRLHFDLRLEHDGVLLSWAVPRGPCLDPQVVRLAVETEDHPVEYAEFEGVIPEGNYGAGAMIVWDKGLWIPLEDPAPGLKSGKLLFELKGYKLRGVWTLVRTQKNPKEWLLIKKPDAWARAGEGDGEGEEGESGFDQASVLSGLTVEELRDGRSRADQIIGLLRGWGADRGVVDVDEVELMLAQVAEGPFARRGWIFELKYDGYRLLAAKRDDEVQLRYRSGGDATDVFPEIARTLAAMPYDQFVIDGEVAVVDDGGRPRFQRLQKRGRLTRRGDIAIAAVENPATLFAFDLLGFEGYDLRELSLLERKEALQMLLPAAGPIRFAGHVEREGEALFEQVVKMGLEGLVGKDACSRYRGGRTEQWLKIRAERTGLFAVVGYTAPQGGRSGFGALHVAVRAPDCGPDSRGRRSGRESDLRSGGGTGQGAGLGSEDPATRPAPGADSGEDWVYIGRVGSGFTDRQLDEVSAVLERHVVDDLELGGPVPQGDEHTWVEPVLVCEVRYKEVTEEGLLRQPVFLGLRDDAPLEQCVVEPEAEHEPPAAPIEEAEVTRATSGRAAGAARRDGDLVSRPKLELTRIDKVFWPEEGYTKGDLIHYYESVEPWIRPYLRDRPLVLDRYPDGIEGGSFFQKNAPEFTPGWIRTVPIEEGEGKVNNYIICNDLDTLRYVANSASIPLHLWSSCLDDLEHPDWCILDLDPKEAPFEHVVTVARAIRELCDEMGTPCYVKTSGKTGLHLLVPLGRQFTYEQSKLLGELMARVVAGDYPEIATVIRNPSGRGARVYIDYVQNGRGRLLVAPLCVRPVPGATVSTPLRWHEVTPRLDVSRYTIESVPRRLRSMKSDPMLPVLDEAPDLAAGLERLAARLA